MASTQHFTQHSTAFMCNSEGFTIGLISASLLLISGFGRTDKRFLRMLDWVLPMTHMTSPGLISLDALENVCVETICLIWNVHI